VPARNRISGRPNQGISRTYFGEQVTADLAAGLTERGVAVVSGRAYGIDGAAHRAALACSPAGGKVRNGDSVAIR